MYNMLVREIQGKWAVCRNIDHTPQQNNAATEKEISFFCSHFLDKEHLTVNYGYRKVITDLAYM